MNLSKPIDRSKWVPAPTIYCPQCGNLFVIEDTFNKEDAGMWAPRYYCRHCHYAFTLTLSPPERPEDLLAKVPTIEDRDSILNVVTFWWEQEGKPEDFKV